MCSNFGLDHSTEAIADHFGIVAPCTGEPGTFQDLSVFGSSVLPGGVFVG